MTRVFLSTWGQNDNLGDSVLRRGLLRAFHEPDELELHVFVGNNDDSYLTALGLRGDETLYRDRRAWWREGVQDVLRRRTVLVQTAGELFIPEGRMLAGWRTLAGVLASRVRGGGGIQVGAGARHPARVVPPVERLSRRVMQVVSWRDAETRAAFGVGNVSPDWAFGEGSPIEAWGAAPSQRRLLAVTLRGDRQMLPADQLTILRRLAAEHGLQIQILTQVLRDEDRARELGRALGATSAPLIWSTETHAEWETVVREIYRRSALIASDRAHALIFAATEGAIPLALSGGSIEKLVRIMAPAGFDLPSDGRDAAIAGYVRGMLDGERSVETRVRAARRSLAETRAEISQVLRRTGP